MRSPINPGGRSSCQFVAQGNLTISRHRLGIIRAYSFGIMCIGFGSIFLYPLCVINPEPSLNLQVSVIDDPHPGSPQHLLARAAKRK